jgi:hypothetical protein
MAGDPGRLAGQGSSFNYKGTTFPITKYSVKSTKKMADTSDTSDYDQNTNLIFNTQLPCSVKTELSIEGNFSLTTSANLLASLYSSDAQVQVQLGLTAGAMYGNGLFDLSDFSTDVPSEDTVKYTASLVSYGVFTPGG